MLGVVRKRSSRCIDFVGNVHFRISLRETLFLARYDAVCRRKNLPVAMLLEPAVGYGEEDFFHGDVPFPAQVGQENERNKNFSRQTRGIY